MIDPRDIAALGTECQACDCHRRTDLIETFAARHRVSVGTVRRRLAQGGWTPRRVRKDAGTSRVDAAIADAADAVAKLKRDSQGRLSTTTAVRFAKRKGLIAESLSDAIICTTVNRRARREDQADIQKDPSLTPARRINWKHPGHCLQIDATNCAQWFFREKRGIRLADRSEVYCNKPDQGAAIIRYIATDAFSGCFRVRFYQTNKERADDLVDFLHWVMTPSDDPSRDPLQGVPDVLLLDKGSGNKSRAVAALCDSLDIELRFHRPKNPRAKGAVEKSHDVFARMAEQELSIEPAADLDSLNNWAQRTARWINGVHVHRRYGMPRSAFYAQHRAAVRLPPPRESFVELAFSSPEPRVVQNDLLISFDGAYYFVGQVPGVRPRERVLVHRCVLDADAADAPIRVRRLDPAGEPVGSAYRLVRVTVDACGIYSEPALYRDHAEDERDLAAAARAAELDRIDVPRGSAPADADVPAVPLPRIAAVIAPAEQPKVTRTAALLEVVQRLGRELTPAEIAACGFAVEVGWGDVKAAIDRIHGLEARPDVGRAASAG